MNDTQIKDKTYTCGWCHATGIKMGRDGFLTEHYKPSTHSTVCRGPETYNTAGKTR